MNVVNRKSTVYELVKISDDGRHKVVLPEVLNINVNDDMICFNCGRNILSTINKHLDPSLIKKFDYLSCLVEIFISDPQYQTHIEYVPNPCACKFIVNCQSISLILSKGYGADELSTSAYSKVIDFIYNIKSVNLPINEISITIPARPFHIKDIGNMARMISPQCEIKLLPNVVEFSS